ncbi:helix-turn-helix domain-containing protein [Lentilactobacillus diolivorans]|uniref:helix-turn-helix domain-containing protein n=1 Tax=Lentilactobacillus diolivorans TaxID=179838 RepID=UPI002469AD72|nr:helix-turn-helix domain-containing protein [Lentilactobacillus diolivorans]MDH5106441.1 helix-turn-helix domain-containing protein [Lentilactobacillus diolivorans]
MNNQKQAEKDYLSGMKYKDIADKYHVSINTVKSWKKRYGWQRTQNKKGAHKTVKRVHTKPQKGAHKKEDNSDELTPQQELFAQLVGGQRIPLYRAYQEAYSATKPSLATAMTNGPKLAKNDKVKLRITQISQEIARKYNWSTDSVVASYTFLHDESKADILTNGVKKSTADAMIQSLENITDVLGLKESSKNLARKVKAEAEITETKAKEIQKVNQHDDSTIVIDDLGGADNDGESQTSD